MAERNKKKKVPGRNEERTGELSWKKEAILVGVLALMVLLFISNFGFGGKVGDTISSFFFGVFGLISYGFPVLIFWAALFLTSNRKNKIAWMKVVFGILFLILLCTFVELVVNGSTLNTLKAAYAQGYALHRGGGVIGVLVAKLLVPNVGIAGSYIIVVAGCIISVILVTERSIFSGVKRQSQKVYENTRDEVSRISEEKQQRKKQRRLEKKVEGVAVDTKILPPEEKTKNPHDMNEIKISGMDDWQDGESIYDPKNAAPVGKEMREEKKDSTAKTRRNRQSNKEISEEIHEVEKQAASEPQIHLTSDSYQFPPIDLLKKGNVNQRGDTREHLKETAEKLEQTLRNFGVRVSVTDVCCGPSVTRFELQPEQGVKVSKIVSLADDIKLNLAAADIRIEAPIPGKAAVGIEVPNKENVTVMLRELLESPEFKNSKSKITFAAGKDIAGKVIVSDIAKMPHVLIAGATGSGKSVCINTIVMSILYKARPDEVKLIMIDPKVVELSVYNGIPHLMIPVVTDPKKAAGALNWGVAEMTERYHKFEEYGVRNLEAFNEHVDKLRELGEEAPEPMPQIVIIVDELADLMMVAPGDVEDAICRLAQLARAAGIHLILATQRPSVNVITGLIKANMPSRVAFAVSSGVDSRTILDMNGAEKLLGKGDMLFAPQGFPKPVRVQGAFVSDKEVADVVEFLASRNKNTGFDSSIEAKVNSMSAGQNGSFGATAINGGSNAMDDGRDIYFEEAGKFLIEKEKGSIGMLQRVFKIGFNRAARIMDQLEEAGIVGPEEGTKPRRVLMTMEEFEQYIDETRDM